MSDQNYSQLLHRVVCFSDSKSKWPHVGIVQNIYNTRYIFYAKVECDKSDLSIWKRVSRFVFGRSNKKIVYSIPAARLQVLNDLPLKQNSASGSKSKQKESSYDRLGFNYEKTLNQVGSIKVNQMSVLVGPTAAAAGFSQPPVGEVKRIIHSSSGAQAWVDFTDPVQNISSPECVRFGCKLGHGLLVHVSELLSLEQFAALNHERAHTEERDQYAIQEKPSTSTAKDLIAFVDCENNCVNSRTDLPEHQLNSANNEEPMDTTPPLHAGPSQQLDKIGTSIDHTIGCEINYVRNTVSGPKKAQLSKDSSKLPPLETIVVKLDEFEPIFGNIKCYEKFENEDYVGIAFERAVTENFPYLKVARSLPFEHKEHCGFMVLLSDIFSRKQFIILPNKSSDERKLVLPNFPLKEYTMAPPIQFQLFMEHFNTNGNHSCGIQGRRNSCYIDSTMFSMFAFNDIFDQALIQKSDGGQEETNENARQVIKNLIVHRLRNKYYVENECVGILREVLKPLRPGITDSEMDVEEFLTLLLEEVLQVEPFLHYTHDAQEYMHSIALHNDEFYEYRTTQFLLEKSFKISNIKLEKIPSPALILQMPVCNGKLVNGSFIIPNLTLNLANVVISQESGCEQKPPMLELNAVICLSSNHYTCFAKTGIGALSHWVYFDSSPSTETPQVQILASIPENLNEMEHLFLQNRDPFENLTKKLPEFKLLVHLLRNCYMLIYTPVNVNRHESVVTTSALER